MNRYMVERTGFFLLILTALVVVVPILLVIVIIIATGISAINWEFLSAMPSDGMKSGGDLSGHHRHPLIDAGNGAGCHSCGGGRGYLPG